MKLLPTIANGLMWVVLTGLSFSWLAPASWWMEIRRVHVRSTPVGEPVHLLVERAIYHQFTAEWHVNIRRLTIDGSIIKCTASGGGAYQPDLQLPVPLTLDWWTFPVKCDLPLGEYVMDTVWSIQPRLLPFKKQIVVTSNFFRIE